MDLDRLLTQQVRQGAHTLSHQRLIGGLHIVQRAQVIEFFHFLKVFHDLLFVIFKSIERVKEWKHSFGEQLGFRDIDLHKKRKRDVIEHILPQPCQGIVLEILEEFTLLSEVSMTLKVINQLLGVGMHIWIDKCA